MAEEYGTVLISPWLTCLYAGRWQDSSIHVYFILTITGTLSSPLQPDFLASSLHLCLWQNPKEFWTENSLGLLALWGIVKALCRKRVSGDECSGFNSRKSLDLVQKGMRDPQETKEGGRSLRNFQGGKNLGLCSPRAPQRKLLQKVKGSGSCYVQYCLQIQIQKYLMQSEGKRLDQESLLFRVSNASLCYKGSRSLELERWPGGTDLNGPISYTRRLRLRFKKPTQCHCQGLAKLRLWLCSLTRDLCY